MSSKILEILRNRNEMCADALITVVLLVFNKVVALYNEENMLKDLILGDLLSSLDIVEKAEKKIKETGGDPKSN